MLIKQLIAPMIYLISMTKHSIAQLSFRLTNVYQSTERTLHTIDNIRGLTIEIIPAPCMTCFISESTRKRSFFDQNFTGFTIFFNCMMLYCSVDHCHQIPKCYVV